MDVHRDHVRAVDTVGRLHVRKPQSATAEQIVRQRLRLLEPADQRFVAAPGRPVARIQPSDGSSPVGRVSIATISRSGRACATHSELQIDGDVLEPRIAEDRPVAAVEVGATDMEHLGLAGPGAACHVPVVAGSHVFDDEAYRGGPPSGAANLTALRRARGSACLRRSRTARWPWRRP